MNMNKKVRALFALPTFGAEVKEKSCDKNAINTCLRKNTTLIGLKFGISPRSLYARKPYFVS